MRFALAPLAALALLAGCGGGPTAQEENLTQTGSHPEVTANSAAAAGAGMGNASTEYGTSGAETPGGPVSDQGSAGGDTTSTN
jgi:hypothetical protein